MIHLERITFYLHRFADYCFLDYYSLCPALFGERCQKQEHPSFSHQRGHGT